MSEKYKKKGKAYRARNKNDHDDFFPTYHALTRLYLSQVKFNKNDTFLEPCAGAGDITKVLNDFKYKKVTEFDINPRKESIIKCDFLLVNECIKYDHTISNFPFKLSVDFTTKASKITKKSMSLIFPLDYLHGVDRYNKFYKNGINGFYLDTVFAFIRRPLFGKEYHPAGLIPTGATSFAWFKFVKYNFFRRLLNKLFKITPKLKWIHNKAEMGIPMSCDDLLFEDLK